MSTFTGHLLPGSFFIIGALIYLWVTFHQYFQSKRKGAEKFRSSLHISSSQDAQRFPTIAATFVFFSIVGIIGEAYTGMDDRWVFVAFGNAQHITMFSAYAFVYLPHILEYFRVPVMKNLDYTLLLLAILIEAMLLAHHLHGRGPVEVQMHICFIYTLLATAVCFGIEMVKRDNVLVTLAARVLVLIQGAWFCTVGFLLDPPEGWNRWNQEESWKQDPEHTISVEALRHQHVTMVTVIFAMYIYGGIIFAVLMGILIRRKVMKDFDGDQNGPTHKFHLIQTTDED